MIRTSTCSLKYITQKKKDCLDLILEEYKRVVNIYISILITTETLSKYISKKVETWLSARLQQCAGKQAIQIVKSIAKKDKNIRYKRYKRVYAYFKNKNRQLKFLNKKFSELKLKRKIIPVYNGSIIEFDSRFIDIICGSKSFDLFFKLTSIGNKIKLYLPSKKHKHFNNFKDYELKKSCRLRKENNIYYIDLFFEKESEKIKSAGNVVGIDLGINSLISTSYNEQYGNDFKELLKKLNRKKQKSKGWFRCLTEIKNYIGEQINKIDLSNVGTLILENLKYITIGTKERVGKTTRKYLSKWNISLVRDRIKNRCEVNGVYLAFIEPRYTSRTCPICNTESNKNRQGEVFICINCGHKDNADLNAAINIKQKFLQQSIVAVT